jgi:hypothetical protein
VSELGSTISPAAFAAEVQAVRSVQRRVVDVLFGLVAPVTCWWVNGYSTIFGLPAGPRAGVLAVNIGGPVAGLLWLVLLTAAMTVWIARRPASPVLAGVLAASAVWSLGFGIAILPFTLMGLLFLIGLLGFAPFGSAFVSARAARQAIRAAVERDGPPARRRFWFAAVLAAAMPTGIGWASQAVVDSDLQPVLVGRIDPAQADLSRVAFVRPLLYAAGDDPARELVRAWSWDEEPQRRAALGASFERLTGQPMEQSEYVDEMRRSDD